MQQSLGNEMFPNDCRQIQIQANLEQTEKNVLLLVTNLLYRLVIDDYGQQYDGGANCDHDRYGDGHDHDCAQKS